MAWNTADKIDIAVDEIISVLQTATNLGGLLGIEERDEEPAVPAADHRLPWAYVIPIMEGGDHMTLSVDNESTWHEFPVTVVAYYAMDDISQTSLRTTRGYGYNAFDLLREHACGIFGPTAGLVEADLDVGYWVSVDSLVHFFILKCMFKSLF